MPGSNSILLADDEQTFLNSTAYLLREEGYDCDCVSSGNEADSLFQAKEYDLLIADIHMPGNDHLELVRKVQRQAWATSVILVTGQPTLDSAVRSVQLPVVAYLTKPIDIEQLKTTIRSALENSHVLRALSHARKRLLVEAEELTKVEQWMAQSTKRLPSREMMTTLDDSLALLIGSTRELCQLRQVLAPDEPIEDLCRFSECVKQVAFAEAIQDAIDVIERTKNNFKSKELGRCGFA